jgi:hypothetical protein
MEHRFSCSVGCVSAVTRLSAKSCVTGAHLTFARECTVHRRWWLCLGQPAPHRARRHPALGRSRENQFLCRIAGRGTSPRPRDKFAAPCHSLGRPPLALRASKDKINLCLPRLPSQSFVG